MMRHPHFGIAVQSWLIWWPRKRKSPSSPKLSSSKSQTQSTQKIAKYIFGRRKHVSGAVLERRLLLQIAPFWLRPERDESDFWLPTLAVQTEEQVHQATTLAWLPPPLHTNVSVKGFDRASKTFHAGMWILTAFLLALNPGQLLHIPKTDGPKIPSPSSRNKSSVEL